jgi:hypothetical protein
MTPHETIAMKIAELDAALKAKHPSMSSLLHIIHQSLAQDPDVVTLLKPEDRAVIVAGLEVQTQTQITTAVVSGTKGKALKNVSESDLGL